MDKHIQSINKGIHTDNNEEFQPDGTYRFALNAINESLIGERGGVLNERGNKRILDLPVDINNYVIIGYCLLDNNDKVIFLTNNEVDIIAIHKNNNTYEEVIRTNCLKFNKCKMIDCIFKLHNGCEYMIYFTDSFNKYRSINISSLEQYQVKNYTNINGNNDPNIPDSNGNYGWECGLFSLNPDVINPDLRVDEIINQGSIRLGSYTLFIKLLDINLNATDWITYTNPIYITKPNYVVDSIYGNNNGQLSETNEDGFYYANKSIRLLIENLDTRFEYYQIGIIEKAQGTDTINNAYVSSVKNIPDSGNDTFTLSNINSAEILPVDFTVFTNITTKINVVKAHTQIENRLIVANSTSNVRDWSKFQKAANNIKIEYFTYSKVTSEDVCGQVEQWTCTGSNAISVLDPSASSENRFTNYSDPKFLSFGKSLMRDEIYAISIVWELIDGSESPAFHIPGRPKFGGPDSRVQDNLVQSYVIDGFDYADYIINNASYLRDNTGNGQNIIISTGHPQFDNKQLVPHQGLAGTDFTVQTNSKFVTDNWIDDLFRYTYGRYDDVSCCDWINFNNNNCDEFIERWQNYNTAIRRNDLFTNVSNSKYTYENGYRGVPGYYNAGQTYPEVLDCNGFPIYPANFDVDPVTGKPTNIVMHQIRHHRMPDCKVEELFFNSVAPDGSNNPPIEDYSITDAEKTVVLRNLGIIAHEVEIPEGFEDEVIGYYIVISDRSNNKTVIDKGYMNITDTSLYGKFNDGYSGLSPGVTTPEEGARGVIKQNEFFLSPTEKENDTFYRFINAMELHTPKSTYNGGVELSADYIKLEHTYYGDLFFTSPSSSNAHVEVDSDIFLTGAVTIFNKNRPARMLSRIDKYNKWEFKYNIPILGLEYMSYNSESFSTLFPNYKYDNTKFQQKCLIAKYTNNCLTVLPDKNALAEAIPTTGSNWVGGLDPTNSRTCNLESPAWRLLTDGFKINILSNWAQAQGAPLDSSSAPLFMNVLEMFNIGITTQSVAGEDSWATDTAVSEFSSYSMNHSPYMYYVAIKNNITPYGNLDEIKYNKLHSFKIDANTNSVPISGGDTFISRFQIDKTYYDKEPGDDSDDQFSTCASTIIGYVESEINSHFRHLLGGELYYSFPFNTHEDTTWTFWDQVFTFSDDDTIDENLNTQEKKYNYLLDYSSNNREFIDVPLPVTYNFCSECSETFPHTLFYSQISLSSQSFDNYKIFLSNDFKTIPADTGEITDLFNKSADLYVHTENNLWKLNASPQQLNTNSVNNTVSVGQGEFLGLKPLKMFDAQDGYAKGGTIDKFANTYAENSYIWLDRRSRNLFKLDKGINEISSIGLKRFFELNLESNLDLQYQSLTNKPYPKVGTSCETSVGYISCFDPEHNRYILTKKDYKLTDEIFNSLIEYVEGDPIINGQFYYNENGFFVGNNGVLNEIDLKDKTISENKSWTLSYSLDNNSWTSFHSYIPNFLYNDSDTFYSYIDNTNNNVNRYSWEHNYGEFQSFYDQKFDFIIDYIYKKDPYLEKTFDTVEFTSNVWLESEIDQKWIEVPFITFDKMYVYNNNQVSNKLNIIVSNLNPYANVSYNVNETTARKMRNFWKISKFRDMSVNRLNLIEPKFTKDWGILDYSNNFDYGFGYIDCVINPDQIDLNKNVYQRERFTDKYIGVRLFFNPIENYKISLNINTGLKRNRT